jgi:hypothetical protein
MVLVVWWCYIQNGQNLGNFFLSTSSQVQKFRKLTNSKTRSLKGDPLDFTQKAQIVCE